MIKKTILVFKYCFAIAIITVIFLAPWQQTDNLGPTKPGVNFPSAAKMVYAQTTTSYPWGKKSLNEFFQEIYKWALGIAGSLSVLMLVFAGYLYVTSAGSPEQINLAKDIIITTLSGLVLLILTVVIMRAIGFSTPTPSPTP